MHLTDILGATVPPAPWEEGDNLPWNDPDISKRFLKQHLSQETDDSSRRLVVIDAHTDWIWAEVLRGGSCRVLDLGCGPGLYTTRLARWGCSCKGIDFSPASIEYANALASEDGLDATHILGDIRATPFGRDPFQLVMMIYGVFNVFHREEAEAILRRAFESLETGGRLLLEPITRDEVRRLGQEPRHWHRSRAGLLNEEPYLFLKESFWDEAVGVATQRFYAVTQDSVARRYAASYQAYTDAEYTDLLERCGFRDVRLLPGLGGAAPQQGLIAIAAVKE